MAAKFTEAQQNVPCYFALRQADTGYTWERKASFLPCMTMEGGRFFF